MLTYEYVHEDRTPDDLLTSMPSRRGAACATSKLRSPAAVSARARASRQRLAACPRPESRAPRRTPPRRRHLDFRRAARPDPRRARERPVVPLRSQRALGRPRRGPQCGPGAPWPLPHPSSGSSTADYKLNLPITSTYFLLRQFLDLLRGQQCGKLLSAG